MQKKSTSTKLGEYLEQKLSGSTLQVADKSDHELEVRANEDITLHVVISTDKRSVEFSLFSPKLQRPVTFEEVNGSKFLDLRLDDDLKSKNHEAEEADIYVAVNLLEEWARQNDYTATHKN